MKYNILIVEDDADIIGTSDFVSGQAAISTYSPPPTVRMRCRLARLGEHFRGPGRHHDAER